MKKFKNISKSDGKLLEKHNYINGKLEISLNWMEVLWKTQWNTIKRELKCV